MTLDRLLLDAGDHVDALIDRHLGSTATRRGHAAAPPAPELAPELELELLSIIEEPPRAAETTSRPPRRTWTLVAAAATLALVVAGIIAVRRDGDDNGSADIPVPRALVFDRSIDNNLVEKLVFDGRSLWAVRNGSTFLLRLRPDTGEVIQSFSLPEAVTPGSPVVHDDVMYLPTTRGIVTVNTATNRIEPTRAIGDGEVWSIAFTTDAVWLVRRLSHSQSLERWNTDLTQRSVAVDLGPEESAGLLGIGEDLYLATARDGLRRYDETGRVRATVPGIDPAWQMEATGDGTLWIAERSGDVVAVDTRTDTVRSRVHVSLHDVLNIEVTPSSVWVTSQTDRQLAVIDPTEGRVTVRAPLSGSPLALALVNGAAWVSGEGGWAERFVPE